MTFEVPDVGIVVQGEVANCICTADSVSCGVYASRAHSRQRTIFLCRGVDDGGALVGEAGEVAAVLLGECLLDVPVRFSLALASCTGPLVATDYALPLHRIEELKCLVLTRRDQQFALVVVTERGEGPLAVVVASKDFRDLEVALRGSMHVNSSCP